MPTTPNRLQALATLIPGRFRLRTVFVLPFVLQLAATAGLIAYLVVSTGHRAVEDLSLRLRSEITSRVQDKLQAILAAPHILNKINAEAARLNLIQFKNTEALRLYFQRQLLEQPALTLVGFGTEEPVYVDVARLDSTEFLKLALARPGKTEARNWKVDLDGRIVEPIQTDAKYDHRKRPWYTSAVSAGKPGWSKIYVTKTPQRLVVSATRPVYDDASALLGVAVSSLSLSGISEFLNTLKVGKTGQTFIIEPGGELVATSTGELPFAVEGDQPVRRRASASGNTLTRLTAEFLTAKLADLKSLGAPANLEFSIGGERQFVQVVPFTDDKGLSWLIVVVIPEIDFMQDIDAATQLALGLSLAALALACIIGFITARWVSRPIEAINRAAGELALGHWDRTVPTNRTDELGDLAHSFNTMAAQLKDTVTTLEQRVQERTSQLAEANSLLEARVEERTAELKKALEHAMQSEKMATLGSMVAGITHELNTPLGNLRMAAGSLASKVQELANSMAAGKLTRSSVDGFIQYSKETTALIDRASERSAELIKSFKQVAVDQSSERRCRFDLRLTIEQTMQTLGPMLKNKPYEVALDIPPGLELDSFPGPLEQIVTNLITNSLAHAFPDRSRGCMTLQARRLGPDLEITYFDDGIGIPDDVRLHIFDPFFTTKAGQGGSGLGMYTVYNLVTGLFGGSIEVEGRPGVGAKFILTLPAIFV